MFMNPVWPLLEVEVVIPLTVARVESNQFQCSSSLFGSDVVVTADTPEDAVTGFYIRLRDVMNEQAEQESILGQEFLHALFQAESKATAAAAEAAARTTGESIATSNDK